MQNNFPKIPLFFSITFLLCSCFALFFFYRAIQSNNKKAEDAMQQWQIEANRRDEIKNLEFSLETIEGERTLLETHFAKSSDIVPFLTTIEKSSVRVATKVEILSVNILEGNARLAVNMKVSGKFENIYRFIILLENAPYELKFISMDMKREGVQDSKDKSVQIPEWSANLGIELLSFIE